MVLMIKPLNVSLIKYYRYRNNTAPFIKRTVVQYEGIHAQFKVVPVLNYRVMETYPLLNYAPSHGEVYL